jgi:hypothetical protein
MKAGFEKAGVGFSAEGRRLIVSFDAESWALGERVPE